MTNSAEASFSHWNPNQLVVRLPLALGQRNAVMIAGTDSDTTNGLALLLNELFQPQDLSSRNTLLRSMMLSRIDNSVSAQRNGQLHGNIASAMTRNPVVA
jgi:hypothetical protein